MGMLFTGCDILVNNIGCNDPDALNYDLSVEEGDGSCVYYYKDFNNTGGWVNTGWTYSIGGVNKCYDESDCLLSYSNPSTIHKENHQTAIRENIERTTSSPWQNHQKHRKKNHQRNH